MTPEAAEVLTGNTVYGLPGTSEKFTLEEVRAHIAEYAGMSEETLRTHLVDFLSEVAPLAQEFGLRMCCHPDDPPFPLLGLPRIISSEAHYRAVMDAVDIPANGITMCSGSLGVRPDNDLPGMMERLGEKVHFLHLRNIKRDTTHARGSFYEAKHLGGDTDMVALIEAALREEARRKAAGQPDWLRADFSPHKSHSKLESLCGRSPPSGKAVGRFRARSFQIAGFRGSVVNKDVGMMCETPKFCESDPS